MNKYSEEVHVAVTTTLHHVEFPLAKGGDETHYSTVTSEQRSADAVLKARR